MHRFAARSYCRRFASATLRPRPLVTLGSAVPNQRPRADFLRISIFDLTGFRENCIDGHDAADNMYSFILS
jgi:hypothetical protein